MREWGPERTVRAAVLRQLLVEDRWPVHAKGVRLRGARILGHLDLAHARLRCPLVLDRCFLDGDEPLDFTAATAPALTFDRCQLPAGLLANQLAVEYGLNLEGSRIGGPCYLYDAHVKGVLDFKGAQLNGVDQRGYAISADRLTVIGAMFLRHGFTTAGAIRLLGADVKGALDFSDAKINGTDQNGNALFADGITITGGIFLRYGFTATGAIQLAGADIEISLDFTDAQLNGANSDGESLIADGITITGDVFLRRGFTATGAIQLAGADIKGSLDLTDAQLNGTDQHGNALFADRMRVSGDAFLDDGFVANGAISLSGAQINGALLFSDAQLLGQPVALRADGLRVEHELRWSPTNPVQGLVNLERAAVHRLDDDWGADRPEGHWPPAGKLRLDGFTYRGFGGDNHASLQQRLAWIRKSHPPANTGTRGYQAQPYQQLAQVYRQTGQDAEAQQVAIAQHTDLRRHGHLTWGKKVANWLLDVSIRHGYKPGRALWALLVLYLVAFGLLWHAQHQDELIVPTRTVSEVTPAPTALACSPDYPCYYPLGHAFDTVVPIISTGQADHWRINSQAPAGTWYTAAVSFLTILGWAFTTLAVLGFTGIVRKE